MHIIYLLTRASVVFADDWRIPSFRGLRTAAPGRGRASVDYRLSCADGATDERSEWTYDGARTRFVVVVVVVQVRVNRVPRPFLSRTTGASAASGVTALRVYTG